jgi:hypothetical protein
MAAKSSTGTIKEAYGTDKSSHKVKDAKGGKMGGSKTNLSHSLSGTSANQKGGKSKS